MRKTLFKEIRLLPTHFDLDVLVSSCEKTARLFISERYLDFPGDNEQVINTVNVLPLEVNNKQCEPRILLVLENLRDKAILAHELIHVLWALSELVGTEMSKDSQEWQAHMVSYLFQEIIDIPKNCKVL